MNTIAYKCGFIHVNLTYNTVRVQLDQYATVVQAKSVNSAKRAITKHYKKCLLSLASPL